MHSEQQYPPQEFSLRDEYGEVPCVVRESGIHDVRAIREIHARNHLSRGGQLLGPLHRESGLLVVESEYTVLGYADILTELPQRVEETQWYGGRCENDGEWGIYIRQVAVHPPFQGQGVGSALYKYLFQLYPDTPIYAHVNVNNDQSRQFHLAKGFSPQGTWIAEDFYGAGQYKAHLMRRG